MGRPTFQSKPFKQHLGSQSKSAVFYRSAVQKHPFLLFGLPFISIIVAGSFFLTPATALRYERHDKKVRQMTQQEALSLGTNKRKVDPKEEYYVCLELMTQECAVGANIKDRDWRLRTLTIGNNGGWKDCRASPMASWNKWILRLAVYSILDFLLEFGYRNHQASGGATQSWV
jgi:cytochrome c oxidase assembly protein subunit 16